MVDIQTLILGIIDGTALILTFLYFYLSVLTLRIKKWQYGLIIFSVISLINLTQFIFPHIVVYISGILAHFCGIMLFAKDKFLKKFLYFMIPYIADMIAGAIYLFIRTLLTPGYQSGFGSDTPTTILETSILIIQDIFLMIILSKLIRRSKLKINSITSIYVIMLMIVHLYMMTFVMYVYSFNIGFSAFCIAIIVYMLIFGGLTAAVLYYNNLMNKKQRKQDMIEYQYQAMNTQYEQLRNSYVTYKKLRHDIKDHLNVVNRLAVQGKTEELQTYTNTLTQNWEAMSSKTFCDIPAVDIIIAEKYNAAAAAGIKTDFVIGSIKCVNADNVYLSGIFSNLLNNALEACFNCRHEPYISLRCAIRMQNLVITCRNSMPDYAVKKGDAQNHGYGLHIIDDSAKLLGGTFIYEHDDSVFTATVNIPIKEGEINQ